jgi:hypothetical protein
MALGARIGLRWIEIADCDEYQSLWAVAGLVKGLHLFEGRGLCRRQHFFGGRLPIGMAHRIDGAREKFSGAEISAFERALETACVLYFRLSEILGGKCGTTQLFRDE